MDGEIEITVQAVEGQIASYPASICPGSKGDLPSMLCPKTGVWTVGHAAGACVIMVGHTKYGVRTLREQV